MDYKTIKDVELTGKTTFMRVDFNILDEKGAMGSTNRLKASLPSMRYALEQGAKLVLGTHVQRPKGKVIEKWRTAPIAKEIELLLGGKKVITIDDCVGPKVEAAVQAMGNGDVLLLENLRFKPEEESKNYEDALPLVEKLARFVEVYVLDGFAASHRAHTSTAWLPLYLHKKGKDVVAGYLMKQELDYWSPLATGNPGGIAIVGGAKLKEKMLAVAGNSKKRIKGFTEIFDKVIVGGVVANVFMKAAGIDIGSSKYDEKGVEYTDIAASTNQLYGDRIILPTTAILDGDQKSKQQIEKGTPINGSIADVLLGEKTLQAMQNAPRLAVFGSMGRFEDGYTEGTNQLIEVLSNYNGQIFVGGGDAEKALRGKLDVKMSTGGGASIEYILLGTLPGLEALRNNVESFK